MPFRFFLLQSAFVCGLIPLFGSWNARAEEAGQAEEGAETILVTAELVGDESLSQKAIGAAELRRFEDPDLASALERLGGVNASTDRRGERGLQLRGFEQRQLAVMLDGLPLAVPFDGSLALDWLPVDWIRQVQIVKGAGSLQFGPNGLGGAVNLVSLEPGQGPRLGLALSAADADKLDLAAQHSQRLGPLGLGLSLGYRRVDGFRLSRAFDATDVEDGGLRNNSDSERVHALLRTGLRFGEHDLRLSAWWLEGERGVPPSTLLTQVRHWRFSFWRAQGLSLSHAWRLPAGLGRVDEVVWLRLYANRVDAYDDDTYTTQLTPRAFSSAFDDLSTGLRLRARGLVDSAVGAWIWRAWLGLQHDRHVQDETDALSRSLLSLAPELEWLPRDELRLSFSVQTDVEFVHAAEGQSAAQAWSAGPLLAAAWRLAPGMRVQASAALRSRFPNLKERFDGIDGVRLPNPELEPESAWHFGLDASWRVRPELCLRLAGFDAELVDGIENRPVTGSDGLPTEQLQNLGRARIAGLEAGLAYEPWKRLKLRLSYLFLHARRLDVDEPLAYRPSQRLVFGFDLQILAGLVLASDLRLVGPQDFLHPETLVWGSLGTYVVWDLRLSWQAADWLQINLRGSNLSDSDYMTEYGFPDPGLQIWLGLAMSMP